MPYKTYTAHNIEILQTTLGQKILQGHTYFHSSRIMQKPTKKMKLSNMTVLTYASKSPHHKFITSYVQCKNVYLTMKDPPVLLCLILFELNLNLFIQS